MTGAIAHDNSQGLIGIIKGIAQDWCSRTHWAVKAKKFDGAVWTLIELYSCQSLLKPGGSSLVYRFALGTRHRGIARCKPVGAVRYWLVTPNAIAAYPPVFNLAARKMSIVAVMIVCLTLSPSLDLTCPESSRFCL